jgi:hypothetical protein
MHAAASKMFVFKYILGCMTDHEARLCMHVGLKVAFTAVKQLMYTDFETQAVSERMLGNGGVTCTEILKCLPSQQAVSSPCYQ